MEGQRECAYSRISRSPPRAAIKERLRQLVSASSARYESLQFRGGTLFAIEFQPSKQQPMVVAMRSANDLSSAKVVVDPNAPEYKGSMELTITLPRSLANTLRLPYLRVAPKTAAATFLKLPPGKSFPTLFHA